MSEQQRGGRVLSYSEVSKALDCWAAWDFAYGGRLAGNALKAKSIKPILGGGRAWGAAVAAFHQGPTQLPLEQQGMEPWDLALDALFASLERDAHRMREFGTYDADAHRELAMHIVMVLGHYCDTAEPLTVEQLEHEAVVSLPSRNGGRKSTKYRLQSFYDAMAFDPVIDGVRRPGQFLTEYKLRGQLMPVRMAIRSRQPRWYAWAYREKFGVEVDGVILDERLNESPKAPRLVQPKSKADREFAKDYSGKLLVPSHAKDQMCTGEAYEQLCFEHGVDPVPETLESLKARRWQQRILIDFRTDEIVESGHELVTAAQLIGQLDSGKLYPLRNAKPRTCNGCDFNEICDDPDDRMAIDLLFERKPPKRERQREEQQ